MPRRVTSSLRQPVTELREATRYIARGMDPPNYRAQPRRPRRTDEFLPYLRERLATYPGLSAVRLLRELRERGFDGGYTSVKRAVQEIRPERERRFEVRFETPPGEQAQVDFARFEAVFGTSPGIAHRLAVLDGARLLATDLGPVCRSPGPAIGAALPHRRLRRDRRHAACRSSTTA